MSAGLAEYGLRLPTEDVKNLGIKLTNELQAAHYRLEPKIKNERGTPVRVYPGPELHAFIQREFPNARRITHEAQIHGHAAVSSFTPLQ